MYIRRNRRHSKHIDIMAHVPDITQIGLEDPIQSFLVFTGAWKKHEDTRPAWQLEALPGDVLREIYQVYSKNLNGLHQPAVEDLDTDLVALLVAKGLITPPTTPRLTPEAPGAPIAPPRPTRLAVAHASGQPQATAVRELFGPDA